MAAVRSADELRALVGAFLWDLQELSGVYRAHLHEPTQLVVGTPHGSAPHARVANELHAIAHEGLERVGGAAAGTAAWFRAPLDGPRDDTAHAAPQGAPTATHAHASDGPMATGDDGVLVTTTRVHDFAPGHSAGVQTVQREVVDPVAHAEAVAAAAAADGAPVGSAGEDTDMSGNVEDVAAGVAALGLDGGGHADGPDAAVGEEVEEVEEEAEDGVVEVEGVEEVEEVEEEEEEEEVVLVESDEEHEDEVIDVTDDAADTHEQLAPAPAVVAHHPLEAVKEEAVRVDGRLSVSLLQPIAEDHAATTTTAAPSDDARSYITSTLQKRDSMADMADSAAAAVGAVAGAAGSGGGAGAGRSGMRKTGSFTAPKLRKRDSFDISMTVVRKRGRLSAQSGIFKRWIDRYCVLEGLRLTFYKNNKCDETAGVMDLAEVEVLADATGATKRPFTLGLAERGSDTVHYYSAISAKEKIEWVMAVERAQAQAASFKRRSALLQRSRPGRCLIRVYFGGEDAGGTVIDGEHDMRVGDVMDMLRLKKGMDVGAATHHFVLTSDDRKALGSRTVRVDMHDTIGELGLAELVLMPRNVM